MTNNRKTAIWTFVLFILVAYSLPWVVAPGAGLTLNAYDLAEWSSLHPVVRAASPSLLVTLGLRFLPVISAWIIAFMPQKNTVNRRLYIAFIALIAAALLPPLSFFTSLPDDPNHRQQFMLSVLTLLIGIAGLNLPSEKLRRIIRVVLIVTSLLIVVLTLPVSYGLLRYYDLSLQPGAGGPLYILLHIYFLIYMWGTSKRGNLPQVTSRNSQWAG